MARALSQADLARLLDDVPKKVKWDIVQLALDLLGIVNPVADAASAFISLVRGDLIGFAVGVASIIPIGDVAKLAKFGKYRKAMTELVSIAIRNPKLAKTIRPAMRQISDAIDSFSGMMGQQRQGVMEKFLANLDGIKAAIRRYEKHMLKLSKVERYGADRMARKLGSAGGQFVGHRGMRVSVNEVVDTLASAKKSGVKAVKDEAGQFMEMLALSDGWIATAGRHASTSDATKHITVKIKGIDGQYHLRVDKRGNLFQITHGVGDNPAKALSDIERW